MQATMQASLGEGRKRVQVNVRQGLDVLKVVLGGRDVSRPYDRYV